MILMVLQFTGSHPDFTAPQERGQIADPLAKKAKLPIEEGL
jgi:hypothetical protein